MASDRQLLRHPASLSSVRWDELSGIGCSPEDSPQQPASLGHLTGEHPCPPHPTPPVLLALPADADPMAQEVANAALEEALKLY